MLVAEIRPQSQPSEIFQSYALTIGAHTSIVGALHFDGNIQLEGAVQGEVRCNSLTISECGRVDGLIVADAVTVAGEVDGSIYANTIVLRSTCEVEGEINHSELNLEPGCYFEGKSRRFANPLKKVPIAVQD